MLVSVEDWCVSGWKSGIGKLEQNFGRRWSSPRQNPSIGGVAIGHGPSEKAQARELPPMSKWWGQQGQQIRKKNLSG